MLKTLILSLMFGFVFFTIAMLITDVPARASTISKGAVTGTIDEFCIHARMEANDRLSQGLHASYGSELTKSCGAL